MSRRRPPPLRPRLHVEELEPRLLYSADAALLLDPALGGAVEMRLLAPAPAAPVAPIAPVAPALQALATLDDAAQPRELVLVDARVANPYAALDALAARRGGGASYDLVVLEADRPAPEKQYPEREDSVQVKLRAGKGLEYKVKMLKYGRLKYEWLTDQGIVYSDFHGDVKQANPPKDIYYESYAIAYINNMIGNLLAPYEGRHGWYFKNITDRDLTITVRMKGQYELEH